MHNGVCLAQREVAEYNIHFCIPMQRSLVTESCITICKIFSKIIADYLIQNLKLVWIAAIWELIRNWWILE